MTLAGCLRRLQHGSVKLLGAELNGASEQTLLRCRHDLGFIFQAHNLHESLTALENVRMGLAVHGDRATADWKTPCEHILAQLGLAARLHYLPAHLSGGQKQRVAIARALVGNPAVVLADEPTAALDKESAIAVVRMLKQLGVERNVTTIIVTHDTKIIGLADTIVTFEDGRIIEVTENQHSGKGIKMTRLKPVLLAATCVLALMSTVQVTTAAAGGEAIEGAVVLSRKGRHHRDKKERTRMGGYCCQSPEEKDAGTENRR